MGDLGLTSHQPVDLTENRLSLKSQLKNQRIGGSILHLIQYTTITSANQSDFSKMPIYLFFLLKKTSSLVIYLYLISSPQSLSWGELKKDFVCVPLTFPLSIILSTSVLLVVSVSMETPGISPKYCKIQGKTTATG